MLNYPEGKLFWGNFVVVVVVVVVAFFSRNFTEFTRNVWKPCAWWHDHPRASLLIINKHQKVMLRQESMGPNQQPSTTSILLTGMDLFNNQDSISIINRYCVYFTPRSRTTQPQLMSPAVSWRAARTENDKHSSCSALTLHRRCAARPGNAFALDRCTNWRVNWRKLFPRDINLTPGSQRKVQHDAACRYLPGFSINWPIANRPERGYLDVHPSSNSAKTQCIFHF